MVTAAGCAGVVGAWRGRGRRARATPPPSCSTPPPPLASAAWWRCRQPSSTAPGPTTRCPHRGRPLRPGAELLTPSTEPGPNCCWRRGRPTTGQVVAVLRPVRRWRPTGRARWPVAGRRHRPALARGGAAPSVRPPRRPRLGRRPVRRVGLDGPCNVAPDGWIPGDVVRDLGVWPRTRPCCLARSRPHPLALPAGPIPRVGAVHGLPVAGGQRPVEGVGLAGALPTSRRTWPARSRGGRCSEAERKQELALAGAGSAWWDWAWGSPCSCGRSFRRARSNPEGRSTRTAEACFTQPGADVRRVHHRPGVVVP
jgi:hypothetical protein